MGRPKVNESLKQVYFVITPSNKEFYDKYIAGYKSAGLYAKSIFENETPTFLKTSKKEELKFGLLKKYAHWINEDARNINFNIKAGIGVSQSQKNEIFTRLDGLNNQLNVMVTLLNKTDQIDDTSVKKLSYIYPRNRRQSTDESCTKKVSFYVRESFFNSQFAQLNDAISVSLYAKDLFEAGGGVVYISSEMNNKKLWLMSNLTNNISQIIAALHLSDDFEGEFGSDEHWKYQTQNLAENYRFLTILRDLEQTFQHALFGAQYSRRSVNDKGFEYVDEHQENFENHVLKQKGIVI